MTSLRDVLESSVRDGSIPGAVGLVARGGRVEAAAVGFVDLEHSAPMARDSIFRIASITKPITAAAVMLLIDDGVMALDDPVERWLPELASPKVVRDPSGPIDDVVPAARPITVADVLDSRVGYGFTSDFGQPVIAVLFDEVQKDGRRPQALAAPDAWMAALARLPLAYQPGEAWLYNIASDLQGVLVARASGRSLPEFTAERIFGPLNMTDTAFAVPADKLDRFTSAYQPDPGGKPELFDRPDGWFSAMPDFASGAGGLVSTADDWHAFGRMLLEGGTVGDRRLLSAESVRLMTTNHLTERQREFGALFLEGQGWGFGGSVDVARIDPWNVPGRYGWVGGSGTTAHIVPSTGAVAILMTQVAMTSPTPPTVMRDFWRYAAA